jgi:hypothetical protein
VPGNFDHGDRRLLIAMISELEIPGFAKGSLTKLLNESGAEWHQKLNDLRSKR